MRITPVNHILNFKAKNTIQKTALVPLLYLAYSESMKDILFSQQQFCTNTKNTIPEKLESVPYLIENGGYHIERERNNPTEYERNDEDDDQYWLPW